MGRKGFDKKKKQGIQWSVPVACMYEETSGGNARLKSASAGFQEMAQVRLSLRGGGRVKGGQDGSAEVRPY